MLSANFKPKRTAAASRGFLAIARLSRFFSDPYIRLKPDPVLLTREGRQTRSIKQKTVIIESHYKNVANFNLQRAAKKYPQKLFAIF